MKVPEAQRQVESRRPGPFIASQLLSTPLSWSWQAGFGFNLQNSPQNPLTCLNGLDLPMVSRNLRWVTVETKVPFHSLSVTTICESLFHLVYLCFPSSVSSPWKYAPLGDGSRCSPPDLWPLRHPRATADALHVPAGWRNVSARSERAQCLGCGDEPSCLSSDPHPATYQRGLSYH